MRYVCALPKAGNAHPSVPESIQVQESGSAIQALVFVKKNEELPSQQVLVGHSSGFLAPLHGLPDDVFVWQGETTRLWRVLALSLPRNVLTKLSCL